MEHSGYVEKRLDGAQTKGVNRRVIEIEEQAHLHDRRARYQFPSVPHFQKAYIARLAPSGNVS
ncbi:MAG: hypothetical protein ACYDCS_12040 [Candidatus Dormibacteria bacterium]